MKLKGELLMVVTIICIYIALTPIVLALCKAAGMDEKFREINETIGSK